MPAFSNGKIFAFAKDSKRLYNVIMRRHFSDPLVCHVDYLGIKATERIEQGFPTFFRYVPLPKFLFKNVPPMQICKYQ